MSPEQGVVSILVLVIKAAPGEVSEKAEVLLLEYGNKHPYLADMSSEEFSHAIDWAINKIEEKGFDECLEECDELIPPDYVPTVIFLANNMAWIDGKEAAGYRVGILEKIRNEFNIDKPDFVEFVSGVSDDVVHVPDVGS